MCLLCEYPVNKAVERLFHIYSIERDEDTLIKDTKILSSEVCGDHIDQLAALSAYVRWQNVFSNNVLALSVPKRPPVSNTRIDCCVACQLCEKVIWNCSLFPIRGSHADVNRACFIGNLCRYYFNDVQIDKGDPSSVRSAIKDLRDLTIEAFSDEDVDKLLPKVDEV